VAATAAAFHHAVAVGRGQSPRQLPAARPWLSRAIPRWPFRAKQRGPDWCNVLFLHHPTHPPVEAA